MEKLSQDKSEILKLLPKNRFTNLKIDSSQEIKLIIHELQVKLLSVPGITDVSFDEKLIELNSQITYKPVEITATFNLETGNTSKIINHKVTAKFEINKKTGQISYAKDKIGCKLKLIDEISENKPKVFDRPYKYTEFIALIYRFIKNILEPKSLEKKVVLLESLLDIDTAKKSGEIFFKKLQNIRLFLEPFECKILDSITELNEVLERAASFYDKIKQERCLETKLDKQVFCFYTTFNVFNNCLKISTAKASAVNNNEMQKIDLINKIFRLLLVKTNKQDINSIKSSSDGEGALIILKNNKINYIETTATAAFITMEILGCTISAEAEKNGNKSLFLHQLSELDGVNFPIDEIQQPYFWLARTILLSEHIPNLKAYFQDMLEYYFSPYSIDITELVKALLPTTYKEPVIKQKNQNKVESRGKIILDTIFKDCTIPVEYANGLLDDSSERVIGDFQKDIDQFATLLIDYNNNLTAIMQSGMGKPLNIKKYKDSACWTFELNIQHRVSFVPAGPINNPTKITLLQIGDHPTSSTINKAKKG